MDREIVVKGAREHNLQNVDLTLPHGKMICFTGVSGSGKSSLAFDTIYAEGQRRYLESLSSYARQFIGQLPKPDVDLLSGLSPSISISQKSTSQNPRSTVGTITEIQDFLRIVYARVATSFCPSCNKEVSAQTIDQIAESISETYQGQEIFLLAPLVRMQKGEFRDLFVQLQRQGFLRARVDGQWIELANPPKLDKLKKHRIELVIDRLTLSETLTSGYLKPLTESIQTAVRLGEGSLIVTSSESSEPAESKPKPRRGKKSSIAIDDTKQERTYSTQFACAACGISLQPPSPQLLSFNSPQGRCESCDGLGVTYEYDIERLIVSPNLSIRGGAIGLLGEWSTLSKAMQTSLRTLTESMEKVFKVGKGYLTKTPWQKLSEEHRQFLLHGTDVSLQQKQRVRKGKNVVVHRAFPGLLAEFRKTWESTKNPMQRRQHEKLMKIQPCATCNGQRLNAQARHLKLKTNSDLPVFRKQSWLSLAEVGDLSLQECLAFFNEVSLDNLGWKIADEAIKEIRARLGFLLEVGLEYLTLNRTAPTLSGGESQRIRLASQIGAGLVGVTYVLDEPSIGLHPRDNDRLIHSLKRLRDLGNTLLVVEHDEDTMQQSDLVIDFGPGPGVRGGKLLHVGHWSEVANDAESLTGAFLSGRRRVGRLEKRRAGNGKTLQIKGAKHHNLKNIDVEIPLGKLVCVTGVSGSGKSSLISDILTPALSNLLMKAEQAPGDHDGILGYEHLDKIIDIDQSPIGRTPRSNPATYVKVFDEIRNLYAQMPDAKRRGYKAGRFSFNTEGGRCSACDGNGATNLDMEMLADIWVTCPVCEGKRFDRETLDVKFKDATIADTLEMDVQQALQHYENVPKIAEKLQTLHDVGLDYIKLGQPSPTLSGGEAQRIKLAKELSRRSTGKTIFVLDEPTTGLHFHDIDMLLSVLQKLVDLGNTVVVVEHNLDLIQAADWLIDLGLEGGEGGGHIIATGSPEDVIKNKRSYTAVALAKYEEQLSAKQKSKRARANRTVSAKKQVNSMAALDKITVQKAQMHNLKSIDLEIPRDKMSVFCGHSGSGKTSLAMDTIYAEGQRRYVESLSSYARQFVGQMPKPNVGNISGLSPAVALEQKNLGHTPRSTVGTVTEIYDYLRVLMARAAQMRCPDCKAEVKTQTIDQIVERVLARPTGTKALLLAPMNHPQGFDDSEFDQSFFDRLAEQGYNRYRINGRTVTAEERIELNSQHIDKVQVVVDRITIDSRSRSRIADSVEQALRLGEGRLQLAIADDKRKEANWDIETHSQFLACVQCGQSYDHLTPHHFSFNSQIGWCNQCNGLGKQIGQNLDEFLDPTLSLDEQGLKLWPNLTSSVAQAMMRSFCSELSIDRTVAIGALPAGQRQQLLFGTAERWFEVAKSDGVDVEFAFQFRGVANALDLAARSSIALRMQLDSFVAEVECLTCSGSRVRAEAANAVFHDMTIVDMVNMSLGRLLTLIESWKLTKHEQSVCGELLTEVKKRLSFLVEVGLEYLTLGRAANTLSGGEAQRIRLAAQLGSGLCGVLYVLDEPTIGLHPRDNQRLISAMHRLRDHGNTLVVVEHDRDVIANSDQLYDFGPGSGHLGGTVVDSGPVSKVKRRARGVTGPYLSGKKAIAIPSNRRPVVESTPMLTIRDASMHNLRHVDVSIPLGRFTAIAGPSGSGKSSLINGILYPVLARKLHRAYVTPGPHKAIDGVKQINKVVRVDQSPLGNSPSSTPATYTGVFDDIRSLFAKQQSAKDHGLTSREFSFNVHVGRCEKCEGNGQCKIEMHFLPDVWVECDACHGMRYQQSVLDVRYRGKTIYDVLTMSVVQAKELFAEEKKILRVLDILDDVGLGYMSLGQSAPTLSGGEAQRVKLAAELARPSTGRTLYLFDEPTTGLHFDDIAKLLHVFHRLVDQGNSVVVIEHNLDVIKSADWVIELGPDAGWDGGRIVFAGTPEQLVEYAKEVQSKRVASNESKKPNAKSRKKAAVTSMTSEVLWSHTGIALAQVLEDGPYEHREAGSKDEWQQSSQLSERQPLKLDSVEGESLKLDSETLALLLEFAAARGITKFNPNELLKDMIGSLDSTPPQDDSTARRSDETLFEGVDEILGVMFEMIIETDCFDVVRNDELVVRHNETEQWMIKAIQDDDGAELKLRVPTSFLRDNAPPMIINHSRVQASVASPKVQSYRLTENGGWSILQLTITESSSVEIDAWQEWVTNMSYAFHDAQDINFVSDF